MIEDLSMRHIIDNSSVNTNYGNNSTINVRDVQNLYGLIKFDLSSIPTSATIESATISLYLNTTVNTKKVSFHRVLQDWNEDDVMEQLVFTKQL
ncbi:MAG: DNRLRE domain-containing protein [ANME-2 cluster archaeon]|nr:DNRLRE domain-containing protein [ANME-2 cluster archaeon]